VESGIGEDSGKGDGGESGIGDMKNGGARHNNAKPPGRSMVLEVPSRYLKEFRERCAGTHAETVFPKEDAHSS